MAPEMSYGHPHPGRIEAVTSGNPTGDVMLNVQLLLETATSKILLLFITCFRKTEYCLYHELT